MPKTNKIIQSLNSGELSPLMDMRIDQDKYQMGCRTMENFYPLIYGGAERRPGTYYTATSKVDGDKIRLVDFIYSQDQAYIMEFGEQYIRFYANNGRFVGLLLGNNSDWRTGTKYYAGDFVEVGGVIYRAIRTHTSGTGNNATPPGGVKWTTTVGDGQTSDLYPIYEIQTPYITEDLFQLKFEQSADVMYITHPDYEPRKLSRISPTTFVLKELDYRDGPFQDVNAVLTAKIAVDATDEGDAVTLTASGTNSDGTSFEPFKSGTGVHSSGNGGHVPSGAGDFNQTFPAITGALFQIIHESDANAVANDLSSVSVGTSIVVRKGVEWDATTNGIWTGTINLERSYDNGTSWGTLHTVVSKENNNVQVDGVEDFNDALYRWNMTDYTAPENPETVDGVANVLITIRDSSVLGVVEISSVSSGTVATGTVRSTIGDTTATHRWAEGYWSNYRGWPNSVAISSEERLTFAGSPSFPLTVWGSVSGDYTSMLIGVLDDDALIFTLVGSGRQNEIIWITSKDALILGTYGGEHVLGASDDKEAMTPTNVRARIQSTYGSKNVQSMVVGDSVLYWQRGGRKLREMHYDFAKDAQISDDLTVFSNHITESSITQMAYQRIPDPMVWATRDDGQLAVMSYERAQDVYSWCRVWTATNRGVETITAIADADGLSGGSAGDIRVTISGTHAYVAGDNVTLYGSTGYDGDYTVTYSDDTSTFDVTATFVATGTGSVKGTDLIESDIESVAVIPTGGEEEQVWISVERVIPGVNSGNPVRYIEYFSTRDY